MARIAYVFLLFLGLFLFVGSAQATVTEYNFTGQSTPLYIDFDTGDTSGTTNASMDYSVAVPISTVIHSPLGGSNFARLRGGLEIDCASVTFGATATVSNIGTDRQVFCIQDTTEGNKAILKYTRVVDNTDFDVTVQVQDDGSWNFFNTTGNLNYGNCNYNNIWNVDGQNIVYFDTEKCIQYYPFGDVQMSSTADFKYRIDGSTYKWNPLNTGKIARLTTTDYDNADKTCQELPDANYSNEIINTNYNIYCVKTTEQGLISKFQLLPSGFNDTAKSDHIEVSGFIQGNNSQTYYFDFESTNISDVFFTGADIIINSETRTFLPITPSDSYRTDLIDDDNLRQVNCGNSLFDLDTHSGVNSPEDSFDIFCTNLSIERNGTQWYGAIKVVNITDVVGLFSPKEVMFYYRTYNPSKVLFYDIELTPDPPQIDENLTVFWRTSKALNESRFEMSINTSGEFIPFYNASSNISSASNLLSHTAYIDKSQMTEGTYQYVLSGIRNNVLIKSDTFNFSIGYDAFVTPNASLPTSARRIADSEFVETTTDAVYLLGFIILLIFSIIAFAFGGMKLGLSVFVSLLFGLAIVELLPIFLILPLIVIATIIVVILFRKILGGADG